MFRISSLDASHGATTLSLGKGDCSNWTSFLVSVEIRVLDIVLELKILKEVSYLAKQ